MTHAARRLVPLAFAVLALAAMAPGDRGRDRPAAFPTQSLGNRGADVRAIQGLLRAHGITVAVDGIFGAATRDAVKAFQAANGLPANGIVRDDDVGQAHRRGSARGDAARRSRSSSASSTRSAAPA